MKKSVVVGLVVVVALAALILVMNPALRCKATLGHWEPYITVMEDNGNVIFGSCVYS